MKSTTRIALAGVSLLFIVTLSSIWLADRSEPAVTEGLAARVERVLTGHTAMVWHVAFSPDGRYLASASVDRTAILWDWRRGTPERTLTHPQGVTSLAFSPSGEFLATGSYDGIVRVWRVDDGTLRTQLSGHQGTVWSVAFGPNGDLASGGEDRVLRIWRK